MELNNDYNSSKDGNLIEEERNAIVVRYHSQVVEWFLDGVVFPIVYLISVGCAIRSILFISDTILK